MPIGGADNIVSKTLYLSANNRSQSSLQREAEQDSQTKPQKIKQVEITLYYRKMK